MGEGYEGLPWQVGGGPGANGEEDVATESARAER